MPVTHAHGLATSQAADRRQPADGPAEEQAPGIGVVIDPGHEVGRDGTGVTRTRSNGAFGRGG
jgi:hypothetical protein